jgi:hypothetical protein
LNLQEHYQSYCESLKKDALEGYEKYARDEPTKNPAQWPAIFDYISELVPIVHGAIANNDPVRYFDALKKHQFAMISLFSKMVKELTYDCVDPSAEELTVQLAGNWTGSWAKFCNDNYTKVTTRNTREKVNDWTQPLEIT